MTLQLLDASPLSILSGLLARHHLTEHELRTSRATIHRAARREAIDALGKAGFTAEEVGDYLALHPVTVGRMLRGLATGGQTHRPIPTPPLPPFIGPIMKAVRWPKEAVRREGCAREAECVGALAKREPAAPHAACPADCRHFLAEDRERVRADAMRGLGVWRDG